MVFYFFYVIFNLDNFKMPTRDSEKLNNIVINQKLIEKHRWPQRIRRNDSGST